MESISPLGVKEGETMMNWNLQKMFQKILPQNV
jgi:hypothetical protein